MKSQRLVCRLVALLGIGAGVLATPGLAQDCPELVGSLPGGYTTELAVSGGYAYVADWLSGLSVIDVSEPTAPVVLGATYSFSIPVGVAVSGGYAYVVGVEEGGWNGSFDVIDVSTPSAPVLISFLGRGEPYDVAVSGHFAYVAQSDWWFLDDGGLHVIGVYTPSAPVEVGFLATPDSAYGVVVENGHAYVAGGSGLRVIDVTTPALPIEVGFLATPDEGYGVAVEDGYAYVAGGSGLRVIDVTTPALPIEVGFLATPMPAWDVAVSRGYAYVAVGDVDSGGLYVIDVATPSVPAEVGFYQTGGEYWVGAGGVAVSDRYVFLAAVTSGLYVFRECPMFSDGFESGDTSAWSATVP